MKIPIKRLRENAIIPTRNEGDAGFDLYFCPSLNSDGGFLCDQKVYVLETGIQIEIPPGYCGVIWDRSGLSIKHGIHRVAGVIDSSYRGEIKVGLINLNSFYDADINEVCVKTFRLYQGDRIAQILFQKVPDISFVEVDELGESERGEKGFGSSGR